MQGDCRKFVFQFRDYFIGSGSCFCVGRYDVKSSSLGVVQVIVWCILNVLIGSVSVGSCYRVYLNVLVFVDDFGNGSQVVGGVGCIREYICMVVKFIVIDIKYDCLYVVFFSRCGDNNVFSVCFEV